MPALPELQAALPTGKLRVRVAQCLLPPEELFTFAVRRNPKRAFLFLSKVLGKHLPVGPRRMADTHRRLAALVPPDLPEPLLFIGMAETATALGQGLFEAWLSQNPQARALFLHSTRYQVRGAEAVGFAEAHSHAPRQWLMLPSDSSFRARLAETRSLVLVDDEISTGKTLRNLAQVCRCFAPQLARIHLACLTDFSGEDGLAAWQERCFLPVSRCALLSGDWQFTPQDPPRQAAQDAEAEASLAAETGLAQAASPVCLEDPGLGRCGLTGPLSLDADCLDRWTRRLKPLPKDAPILVLGTGEFMFPAFKLALALQERIQARILFQSTTRSPILPWGAIHTAFHFADNYNEGIANFLYNFQDAAYAQTLICHETPLNEGLRELARHTGAALLHFGGKGIEENLEFCPH